MSYHDVLVSFLAKTRAIARCFFLLLVPAVLSAPGHAAAAKALTTYVSPTGNNANDCLTLANACRQIGGENGALSKTAQSGTVHVLPGAYKAFDMLGRDVDIIADAGQATIDGFVEISGVGRASIGIDGQSGIMRFRGFTIGSTDSGVAIYGGLVGAAVHFENCMFESGLASANNAGIEYATSGGGPVELYVSNSSFEGPGYGIAIRPKSTAKVVLDNVNIENTAFGLFIDAKAANSVNGIIVRDTVIAGGQGGGLGVLDDANGTTTVMIEGSTIGNNASTGVLGTGANVIIRVRNSTIIGNMTTASGAQIISHGGNVLVGGGAFTSTVNQQ